MINYGKGPALSGNRMTCAKVTVFLNDSIKRLLLRETDIPEFLKSPQWQSVMDHVEHCPTCTCNFRAAAAELLRDKGRAYLERLARILMIGES